MPNTIRPRLCGPLRRARTCAVVVVAAVACDQPVLGARHDYPHARDPIGTVREIYDGTLTPAMAVNTFRNIDRLFPTRAIRPADTPRTLPPASRTLSTLRFTSGGHHYTLDEYFERNRVAAMLVLLDGRVVLERYRYGNGPRTRWMSMSVAKSITSTLIGAALKDGHIRSLDDTVTTYVPALRGSAYDVVTVRQVLQMSSGVRWSERYTDPTSDRRRLLEAQIAQTPGAVLEVLRGLPRAAAPGSVNTYSTGETQVAGEIVRGAVGRALADYASDRIWRPAGMQDEARWWLDAPDGAEIGGSGISATLRDYARFGQFILEEGVTARGTMLPSGWVAEATGPTVLSTGERVDYGYLWWPSTSERGRRDRAFSAIGIHGQLIHINPAVGAVVVAWGAQPRPTGGDEVDDQAFLDALMAALRALKARGPAGT